MILITSFSNPMASLFEGSNTDKNLWNIEIIQDFKLIDNNVHVSVKISMVYKYSHQYGLLMPVMSNCSINILSILS